MCYLIVSFDCVIVTNGNTRYEGMTNGNTRHEGILCHCEECFLRRGNLLVLSMTEGLDIFLQSSTPLKPPQQMHGGSWRDGVAGEINYYLRGGIWRGTFRPYEICPVLLSVKIVGDLCGRFKDINSFPLRWFFPD